MRPGAWRRCGITQVARPGGTAPTRRRAVTSKNSYPTARIAGPATLWQDADEQTSTSS